MTGHEEEMPVDMSLLREYLDTQKPLSDPAAVAMIAQRKNSYRRAFIRFGIPGIAVILFLGALLMTKVIVPETQRLLAPPPPVVVKTFATRCLAPKQVAGLLRPYLPKPQNPRWQAEMFDVVPGPIGINAVTVRAPQELIDRVPVLIQQFESQFGSTCTR